MEPIAVDTPIRESEPVKRKREIQPEAAQFPIPESLKAIGSRMDVFYGHAIQTAGGLTKKDLILNARGRVVSKRMSENAKKRYPQIKDRLRRAPSKAVKQEQLEAETRQAVVDSLPN